MIWWSLRKRSDYPSKICLFVLSSIDTDGHILIVPGKSSHLTTKNNQILVFSLLTDRIWLLFVTVFFFWFVLVTFGHCFTIWLCITFHHRYFLGCVLTNLVSLRSVLRVFFVNLVVAIFKVDVPEQFHRPNFLKVTYLRFNLARLSLKKSRKLSISDLA